MVSKARLLLPEPERPVMTTSRSRGMTTSIFFRLCSRAPRTTMRSCDIEQLLVWMTPARRWRGPADGTITIVWNDESVSGETGHPLSGLAGMGEGYYQ